MANLRIENLAKAYGETRVLSDINLSADNGEFVVLVGPSGCGKSTLLRLIAGLEGLTAGRVLIDGKDVSEVAPASAVATAGCCSWRGLRAALRQSAPRR